MAGIEIALLAVDAVKVIREVLKNPQVISVIEAHKAKKAGGAAGVDPANIDVVRKKAESKDVNRIEVQPIFKMVFLTIVAITIVAGATQVALAEVWQAPTPNQQSAFEAIGFAWKTGIGAIVGLVGGKVT